MQPLRLLQATCQNNSMQPKLPDVSLCMLLVRLLTMLVVRVQEDKDYVRLPHPQSYPHRTPGS